MNRYRTYMDRIQAPEELRDRILAGERPRRSRPALAAGVLAACCLVVAVGGWQLWQGRAETQLNIGAAATPAGNQQSEYTLVVEDPFEGQPHSFPNILGYDYPDCTSSDAMAADYAPPDGWFMEVMSAQEIITALGGTDQVPWTLDWTGFGLDGMVTYDGEGKPWRIQIWGTRGEEGLMLELWPGREPLIDLIYADAGVETVDGMEVTTYSLYYDSDGDDAKEHVYHAHYFDGEMGVSFSCNSGEAETGARLTSLVVGHEGFTAEGLTPETMDADHLDLGTARLYGSGELTLGEAYQQELSEYLPDKDLLPDGFTFESAQWHFDEVEDSLSILWCRGYDNISVRVEQLLTPRTEEKLPGDLLPHEVDAQTLEGLGRYVDDDQGDTAGWRYDPFTVYYTEADGGTVAVTWSIRGLEPEQAADLVKSVSADRESRVHPITGVVD